MFTIILYYDFIICYYLFIVIYIHKYKVTINKIFFQLYMDMLKLILTYP